MSNMRKEERKKTVVINYYAYVSDDGKEFETERECIDYEKRKNGERITCPDCGGRGYFDGRWIEPYDNYDIGHVDGHYETTTCKKCGGKGYLDKKVSWG